ncbi:hypothetical protein KBZ16_13155 [Vulcanococcus limneticus Candia 3B3]|nr:hypothetical protein [Vulcanococcus limneticus]MCP9792739.1 hypothetical protein [Vulcanococcus limneticus MW73D5]MCP9898176.1 hypothetical protein [Vulcanococcus limneticus Candia 3B3]
MQSEPRDEKPEGLGRRIAALFAEAQVEHPIPEWHGEEARPAVLGGC